MPIVRRHTMDSAIKTVHELGAFWFLEKPIQASALEALVRRAASHGRLRNDNRSLFRSRLLLDQDRAVRSANLARIYADAGMNEVGFNEAAKAVSADYANFSSHQFLAESFNALRDPRQINLRYETAWLNEYLVANLLAPAGAGALSPQVSQHEYARLFEQDRIRFGSLTEYGSRGDWLQSAVQNGRVGNSAYAAEMTSL